jgi:hypothetical protein
MNKVVPDPPRSSAKDRAAFHRALDHYLPNPPVHDVIEDLSFEDALLDSASATALDCGESLASPERAKILAVWPLLEIASATVDRSIECMTPSKPPV